MDDEPTNYDRQYRPIPAGAAWQYAEDDGHFCTTGCPGFNPSENDNAIITAGHCFTGKGDDDGFYQYEVAGSEDGYLADYSWIGGYDAAVVDMTQTTNVTHEFASPTDDGYRDYSIEGILDREAIVDISHSGEWLDTQGAGSGGSAGPIVEVNDIQFEMEAHAVGGDSGGPAHMVDQSEDISEVGGLISGYEDIGGGTFSCTMMEETEDREVVIV